MPGFYPEILAPAGGFEALKAAVRCGADAVYFGGKTLNARMRAGNFGDDELPQAVAFCHARGVRAYITLNTLVRDSEIDAALKTIGAVCSCGADALILQDPGLAALAREAAPGMKLHASTQMSVQTREGLELLKRGGFSRAVLPRELSRAEIQALAQEPPLELEVFVHGALCMSVSGQCFLSAFLGTRSGNRGLCAGPCRLPFRGGELPNALSLRDLSLLDRPGELAGMSITSLKIEGRMKSPEYVAAAVTACRRALDGEAVDTRALEKAFSRSGFTAGYYEGRRGAAMFGVRSAFDELDSAREAPALHKLYDKETPRVGVDFTLEVFDNTNAALTAEATGKRFTARAQGIAQRAKTLSLTHEKAQMLLGKCGGTPFAAGTVRTQIPGGMYLPDSAVNALRRQALAGLGALLAEPVPVPFTAVIRPAVPHKAAETRLYARFANAAQMPEDLSAFTKVILPLGAEAEKAARNAAPGLEVHAEMPRGIFGGAREVRGDVRSALAAGVRGMFAGTLDAAAIAREEGAPVAAGIGTNIFNTPSLEAFARLGVREAVLSFELSLAQARDLGGELPRGLAAYGRLPLMLTRNCPAGRFDCKACRGPVRIKDRLGIEFPVVCSRGFSEVLNSRPLTLADKRADIKNIDFLLLYFTVESRAQCAQIIRDFMEQKPPQGEFTRGLYYRGAE